MVYIQMETILTWAFRTNNWSDYGGMDVYVKQILNSANHDLFYTDASVIVSIDISSVLQPEVL